MGSKVPLFTTAELGCPKQNSSSVLARTQGDKQGWGSLLSSGGPSLS